ncbi:MAG: hypothetical protein H7Y11_05035, partial [Armatimonadetes bacterium]|nr:hypothetical protein [Anaerolineae bacterium]
MSDQPVQDDTNPVAVVRPPAPTPPSTPAVPLYAEQAPLPYAPSTAEQPVPRRSGCGCWVAALLTLLIVAGLVGAGLFLPPISLYDRLFGAQFTLLDPVSNAAQSADGGLTLVLAPADVGLDFGVALSRLDAASFQAPAANSYVCATAARFALPTSLTLRSPVYRIQTTGDAPDAVTFSVKLPANVALDTLDAYGY